MKTYKLRTENLESWGTGAFNGMIIGEKELHNLSIEWNVPIKKLLNELEEIEEEKVIIRKEYDPYMKIWKWLCIFPETYEGNGKWGCVSIWKDGYDHLWHEPYTAGTVNYFYKCKIVHKNTPEAMEVIKGLAEIYGGCYKAVEKMTNCW